MGTGVGTGIGTGKLVSILPTIADKSAMGTINRPLQAGEHGLVLPAAEAAPAAPTVADISLKLAAARQAAYGETMPRSRRSRILMLLLICLTVFVLFFVVGYFAGHWLFP